MCRMLLIFSFLSYEFQKEINPSYPGSDYQCFPHWFVANHIGHSITVRDFQSTATSSAMVVAFAALRDWFTSQISRINTNGDMEPKIIILIKKWNYVKIMS